MTKILIDEATVKLVLEAFEQCRYRSLLVDKVVDPAITALQKALAEQPAQQEPLQNNPFDCGVYLGSGKDHAIKHHVSYGPAQRTWVGLTPEQAVGLYKATETDNRMVLIDAVEAKLKEKNNG